MCVDRGKVLFVVVLEVSVALQFELVVARLVCELHISVESAPVALGQRVLEEGGPTIASKRELRATVLFSVLNHSFTLLILNESLLCCTPRRLQLLGVVEGALGQRCS